MSIASTVRRVRGATALGGITAAVAVAGIAGATAPAAPTFAQVTAPAILQSLPPASDQGRSNDHHQATVALNPQPLPPGRHQPDPAAVLATFQQPPDPCRGGCLGDGSVHHEYVLAMYQQRPDPYKPGGGKFA